MIDQDKMRALAAKLHATSKQLIVEMKCGELTMANPHTLNEAADAIDLLLAEVEGLRAARIAYASEFAPDAEGLPDTGNIHANIRRLKAELEAAAADKRAAKKPDAMTKAVKQLADWLLTDPNEGNPLCFAGPPEPFVLGLSRVKMRSIAGDEWTLIAGLQEGWLNAEQRAANFWRIAKLEREEVAREEAVAALAQRQGEGS